MLLALASLVSTCQGRVACEEDFLKVTDCNHDTRSSTTTATLEKKINAVKKTSVDLKCVRRRRAALALMRCASRCCRLWRGGGCYAPELTAHAWLGGMM